MLIKNILKPQFFQFIKIMVPLSKDQKKKNIYFKVLNFITYRSIKEQKLNIAQHKIVDSLIKACVKCDPSWDRRDVLNMCVNVMTWGYSRLPEYCLAKVKTF